MSNSNSSRMRTIFRSKTSKALDKMEDPRERLNRADERFEPTQPSSTAASIVQEKRTRS